MLNRTRAIKLGISILYAIALIPTPQYWGLLLLFIQNIDLVQGIQYVLLAYFALAPVALVVSILFGWVRSMKWFWLGAPFAFIVALAIVVRVVGA